MDMQQVASALDEFKGSVMQRIEAQEKAAAATADWQRLVEADLTKLSRPQIFGSENGSGSDPAQRKALDGAIRALLSGDQAKASALFNEASEHKGMSAGSSPDGGYTVLDNFSNELMRVMAEISPLSRLARTVNIDTGLAWEEVVDKNTLTASWVSELAARTATAAPALAKFRVELAELAAMPKASQTLVDTASIDIIAWLSGKIAEGFAAAESAAFHSGTGVGQPRGFLTYTTAATADASRTWGEIEHVVTGANGAFATASTSVNSADVLISCMSKMKAQYLPGASWLMSRATAGACRQLKDAQGRHVWVDSLVQGQPNVLFGHPVELSEDMTAYTTTGALAIAFANWQKAYCIVRRQGIKFLVDPFTDKPNVAVYAYQRVGAGVHNFEALKFVKFST
jgi:HK97 family phage major capsid protein